MLRRVIPSSVLVSGTNKPATCTPRFSPNHLYPTLTESQATSNSSRHTDLAVPPGKISARADFTFRISLTRVGLIEDLKAR